MEQGWNFHGHIALPIETIGRRLVGDSFYNADQISLGDFVDAMEEILTLCHIEHKAFSAKCYPYDRMTSSKIGDNTAKELFDEFMDLYRVWKSEAKNND